MGTTYKNYTGEGCFKPAIGTKNDVFLIHKIYETLKPTYILKRSNIVRLWLKVSHLSNIDHEEEIHVNDRAMYGHPAESTLA